MRKIGTMVLTLTLLVSLLAGCGQADKPKDSETVSGTESTEIEGTETEEIIDTEVLEEPTLEELETENTEAEEDEEAEQEEVVQELDQTMYAKARVNVRRGSSTDFEKIGMLALNDEVHVTGQCENGWYRIIYNEEVGYVSGEYLVTEPIEVAAPPAPAGSTEDNYEWVANLQTAQNTNQLIIVAADGYHATVSMHNKNNDGTWSKAFAVDGIIGQKGVGKTKDWDYKTPRGAYSFLFAFGIAPNPGTAMSYTQIDDTYYWVEDPNSAYYNKFVTTNEVAVDWDTAEHLVEFGSSYNYVLAYNYNPDCIPGLGSAQFLHCPSNPTGTLGCIAIPESNMIQVLQTMQPGCIMIIDTKDAVRNY